MAEFVDVLQLHVFIQAILFLVDGTKNSVFQSSFETQSSFL